MFEQFTQRLDSMSNALVLRAQRQQVIASNIANADTPGFVARDFNFAQALADANGGVRRGTDPLATDSRHLRLTSSETGTGTQLAYTVQTQPALDRNTVDMDRERANFTDNAIRYESTLRFINGHVKTMLSAIQGQ
ncbi:flagellar basal body rod protein FlgB [Hydrogenophaga sp. OTU3427]|uniref:flagellar basal body rod protein FlgB n=1 Tax=Hydrogenophaga sp. OTU3427 TaxID=3043856 RepID=UPI00313C74DC